MISSDSQKIEAPFRAFVRAQGLFRGVMKSYFSRFGISGAQWGILRTLYRFEMTEPRAFQLKELSKQLLVRPPSVTGVVDGLERMKLVRRMMARHDQRAKKIKLTHVGKKLVERILKRHNIQMQAVLGGLNDQEQKNFYLLLDKFSKHLESLME